MSDETAVLAASKVVSELFANHAPAHARDILRCLSASYLVWLGTDQGREAIDDLMRNSVEPRLFNHAREKTLRLVVSNSAEIVHTKIPQAS